MTDIENILNSKVSFQRTAYAPLTHELLIKDVLGGIKEERLAYIVTDLRKMLIEGDLHGYGQHKKKLPGVTFSGTFKKNRRRNDLKKYNQIIVLDIDKLSDSELDKNKEILKEDPYVISFWESPSKKGLKGLIYLDFEIEITDVDLYHGIGFKKLVDYFQNNYAIELDESGSDTTRLCFLSSDPNIAIKKEVRFFSVNASDLEMYSGSIKQSSAKEEKVERQVNKKDALLNGKGKNLPQNRFTIKSILKYLIKRNLSITESYEKWYRVAFAIANSFTHDIGEGYFLKLCQQDKEKYNEIECKNLLINCYQITNSEIKFSTIFHYAQELGYNPKNKKGNGSEGV